jgi:hypothetical protein
MATNGSGSMTNYKGRFGIALLSIAALVTAFEMTLRFALGFGHPLLYRADPKTGYFPVANQQLRRFGANIHTNEFGMRSESLTDTGTEPALRLLFIGDSVTFGTTYVDQSKIFTELIKNQLALGTRGHVQVLNASANGWAPDNEYQFLVSRGTLNANVVIFVLNTNDLDQQPAVLSQSPQFPTSAPHSAIQELWTRYVQPRITHSASINDPGATAESIPDSVQNDHVLLLLEAAKKYSESHGARFVLIFSPTDSSVEKTGPWMTTIQKFFDWSIRQNVKLIDMSPIYSKYPKSTVYFDDIHLRPFGDQLVAAEFVKRFADVANVK